MQNADNRMAERLLSQCAYWPCQNPIEIEISAKGRKMRSCHQHIGLVLNRFNKINGTTDRDVSVKVLKVKD